jgi:hypothetical protein
MFQALFGTSETIRRYIEDRIGGIASSGVVPVVLNTPEEVRSSNSSGVSVWLYRITRDPDRLNDPPERLAWNQIKPAPLPLRLHYLITPVTDNATPALAAPRTSNYCSAVSSRSFTRVLFCVAPIFKVHL